jgi:hypothetical protein
MAEGVGVEPTKRFFNVSLVLKTRRPTGDVALPLLEARKIFRKLYRNKRSIAPDTLIQFSNSLPSSFLRVYLIESRYSNISIVRFLPKLS